jgi:endogenous inhibitor of DNA gyrase (YacG/DUF329 family)
MNQANLEPQDDTQQPEPSELFFRICPKCQRAVPGQSEERYCINDGALLLERCPKCQARIQSPYARFCARCGHSF